MLSLSAPDKAPLSHVNVNIFLILFWWEDHADSAFALVEGKANCFSSACYVQRRNYALQSDSLVVVTSAPNKKKNICKRSKTIALNIQLLTSSYIISCRFMIVHKYKLTN